MTQANLRMEAMGKFDAAPSLQPVSWADQNILWRSSRTHLHTYPRIKEPLRVVHWETLLAPVESSPRALLKLSVYAGQWSIVD